MPEMPSSPLPETLPCDPVVQQARQDALDMLYLIDGRDAVDHPLHALYTGLAQQYTSTGAP